MHIKGEKAKRELAELENKEKYAVKKLMEATLQKKRENEGNLFKHFDKLLFVKVIIKTTYSQLQCICNVPTQVNGY